MNAISEEEKTNTTGATVATSIAASSGVPMAKPATIRLSTGRAQSTDSHRGSTSSGGGPPRISLNGLDPLAVQKSLQSELQQWKDMYHEQQKDMQHRIDRLEEENNDLLQEQDILNDRHQSHTEELRYMQNEFLCIKGHLQKLRNEMEALDGHLNEQQKKQNRQKMTREEHLLAEKVEESIFRVKERQEFTCVFMENTIASIDEILNEYIPEKVEYTDVDDHKTMEEIIEEAKLREMREEEELRKRREIERQMQEELLQLQLLQEQEDVVEHDSNGRGSEFTDDTNDNAIDFDKSISTMVAFDEHFSELGIETPAMREAKLFQETQSLFKEQQEMFARYIEERRSDEATSSTTRFKSWFNEKREKWLEEEEMKEVRRKKRQSMAVMMHKVKQMHSDALEKVTETKLYRFEKEQQQKERRSNLVKLGNIDGNSPVPKPTEEEVKSKLEEDLRFSFTKGDLNDYFKKYKNSHSHMMEGAAPAKANMQRQESRGILGILGWGGKAENEMSC